jgi:hypothetical protein
VNPELAAAYHHLYDVVWNQTGTVDIDYPGHNGMTYEDCLLIEQACEQVERLLLEAQRSEISARAEEIHAEHHSGYIVPSLDSCPEHTRAEYEDFVRGAFDSAPGH